MESACCFSALRVRGTVLCLEKWFGAFIHCIGIGSNRYWMLVQQAVAGYELRVAG
jgi:hypothetical protein